MTTLISVTDLEKNFGPIRAVDGISLSVDRGEVLGFLGPNGAGKSTTMKMITGFLAPDGGTIEIAGQDIETAPLAAKRRIGYLPEGAPAYGDMTVSGFLRFCADVRGLTGEYARDRIRDVLDKTQLFGVIHQPIETLSKGFKRRVGLAQALLHDPEILILDEPTDGLDPNQKHEVRTLIRSMARDKAIIISTHILEEVEALCTRVVIIAAGKVRRDATPRELLAEGPLDDVFRRITNPAA
ncbi:MAG: ABC transporter ATP-binding protein [Alphaproteobacteria bacterium]|nr:ABC transporter ATP-binding protein [Alphaproteobacteria bacterium]